jgi:hypothetical protein
MGATHVKKLRFPGKTFRILKEKVIRQKFGANRQFGFDRN